MLTFDLHLLSFTPVVLAEAFLLWALWNLIKQEKR
jgi:hypothetical protein